MAGSDTHLKSLKLFKLILGASETEYRDSSPVDRGPVFKLLIGEIRDAAQELNLTVGDDQTLRNVSTISKKEAEPPIKAGKNWTPRLVADYTYHKEIKEAVENSGLTDPHERIAEWSRAVFEKYNSLSDEERAEFAVIAEKWKKEGPPQEVKQHEAAKLTGKYVQSALQQLWRNLGVHAMVFVTYQDGSPSVKISEFETQAIPAKSRFESSYPDELKALRKKWGRWADETFTKAPAQGSNGSSDEEHQTPKPSDPPAARFLIKCPNGLWESGPLPSHHTLRVELANAFHTYITQQWKLTGGGKKVSWTQVKQKNKWYIDQDFLVPNRTFCDPTRMLEADLHAYWTLWHKWALSGHDFGFKTTKRPPTKEVDVEEEIQLEEEDEVKEDDDKEQEVSSDGENRSQREKTPKAGHGDQGGAGVTPNERNSDAEKISFLQSLCVDERGYQAVIGLVAQLRPGSSSKKVHWPARCFTWNWGGIYSDKALHKQDGDKLHDLFKWLDTDPHLDEEGELVNRASMLQMCLGLGIVLGDAHLIHFTEDGFAEGVPEYIAGSPWDIVEYNKFQNYICKVRSDIEKDVEQSSCKKCKVSTGEPSHPKPKVQKIAAQPLRTGPSDGSEQDNGSGGSDDGTGLWKSSHNRREPQKYGDSETGTGGKGKQKAGQASVQGGAKKKRGGKK